MKMRKILVKEYPLKKRVSDPEKNTVEMKEVPYSVKQSIASILYHPELRLSMREAIARKVLSETIENSTEDFVMVTPEDYTKIKEAFEKVQGYTKDDVELLSRVENAEIVEVELKEKENK